MEYMEIYSGRSHTATVGILESLDATDAKKNIYHILTGPGTRARDFYINYRTGGRSLGRHLRLELAREAPRRAQPEEDDAEEDRREVRRARRERS